jgi:hypothetical protein
MLMSVASMPSEAHASTIGHRQGQGGNRQGGNYNP